MCLNNIAGEIIYSSNDGTCFEFPVLQKMKEMASKEKFYAVYFHTKGASYSWNKSDINFEWKRCQAARWRMLMNYYILYKWNIAINTLARYNAYGILYRKTPYPHFSGNFWWSTSETINSTHRIDEDFIKDRYNAEFWLLNQKKIRVYTPFKRGLLLKIEWRKDILCILPWWHWRNIFYLITSKTLVR